MCREADDVGPADRLLELPHRTRLRMESRQPLGVLEFERADLDVVEIANERQQSKMFPSLNPCADNRGHAALGAGQQLVR